MVRLFLKPVVCADEQISAWNKDRADQRLPKASDRLGLRVKVKKLRYVKKVVLLASVVEDVDKELAVVLVGNGVYGSIVALLDVVHLNISAFVNSFEELIVLGKRVANDFKVLILVVDNSNALLGVIGDDHLDNV